MPARLTVLLLFHLPFVFLGAQQYWATTGSIPVSAVYSVYVNCPCPGCVESEIVGYTDDFMQYGLSMTPNGNLYGLSDGNEIFQINTSNGAATLVFDLPDNQYSLQGIACTSNSICYCIDRTGVDTLMEINITNGTITPRGPLTEEIWIGDLGLFNGQLYYEASDVSLDDYIARIILSDPIVNEFVMDLPDNLGCNAMTATTQCHTLMSKTSQPGEYILINILDGDLNLIAGNPYWNFGVTGLVEFETPGCVSSVDLDCNDSSGSDGNDYQSPDYYCITTNGVPVCDNDIIFLYDTLIDYVTIELSGPLPDGNLEYLVINASFPGLTITGSGTQSIRIVNEGNAPSTIFKLAMRAIRYFNDAFITTLGTRLVRVNGQTYYNTVINEGIAYVEVAPYPAYEFDLGPDTILCEGNSVVLNTNIQNVEYNWSTNETSPYITITEGGQYLVTVSGDEFCPSRDSIEVTFLPSVTVGFTGNQIGCEGEEFYIMLDVESSIPVDIAILSVPGDTILLNDVTEGIEIPVSINEPTYFVLLSVTSSEAMCLALDDTDMDFYLLPAYMDTLTIGICEGDSVLIEPGEYVNQPGYYTIYDDTESGCDSIVTYDVYFTQSVDVFIEYATCIEADTGTFIQFIDNPSGCDTLLETHVVLGPLDTTFVNEFTCRTGEQGVFSETLSSVDGCDSIVVHNKILIAPQDTSWSYQASCDLNELGTFFTIHANQEGCDSLEILSVNLGSVDTTHISSTSCNPGDLGVFEILLQGHDLCDSLVIATVTMEASDTTYTFRTSCDSAFLGVHEILLTNNKDCDSLVIETVSYADKDTTQQTSYTCNVNEAGLFTSHFTNQFGCDSIVVLSVILNPSHNDTIQTGSCITSDTGTFTQFLTNQFGCDSVVTIDVALWPSYLVTVIDHSCHLADTGTFINLFQTQSGCDSIITHQIIYSPFDTTQHLIYTCDPDEAGLVEEWLTTQDGCDSLVQTSVEFEPASVSIQVLSGFNGHAVSCAGSNDGVLEAIAEGIAPFEIQWSTSDTSAIISNISAGHYEVTVTDGNGCSSISGVDVYEPPVLQLAFIVSHPDCFTDNSGIISAIASGGVQPYEYSLDGIHFQSSADFQHLSKGAYELIVTDANQCSVSEVILINQPVPVYVDLGDDVIILSGDSAELHAIVNLSADQLAQINWYGVDTSGCADCLTHIVAPFITTSYAVEIFTNEGCADIDTVTYVVVPEPELYIPNIFSPNNDDVNDHFRIYAGKDVERISRFVIFDRWGGVMFAVEDRLPDDPLHYWDGRSNGKPCAPGVYAYKLVAVLANRETMVRVGNVTLVR